MIRVQLANSKTRLAVITAALVAISPSTKAQKMFVVRANRDPVERAVSDQNLKTVAAKANDAEVLLGFAFMAQTASPIRQSISQMAVKLRPEYAPIVAVLAVAMDGVDQNSVGELIKSDPDNALGYYLQGTLLYQSRKETEALDWFKKGASRPELRLYEASTSQALFKALDALNLKGADRLCALSWMATRLYNFGSARLQWIGSALHELALRADAEKREQISDFLLVVAGHLFASNFNNRWYARHALESAFRLRAELSAAQKSPKMNTYTAVVQALVSTDHLSWPGIDDERKPPPPLELAQFLPERIHKAFALIDPSQRNSTNFYELSVNLADAEKPAFEQATKRAVNAAEGLIAVALTDPDGIMGAYLMGAPPRKYENGPWVSYYTHVEKLMMNRPDLFRAAATNEQAMQALSEAGKGDLRRRNIRKMMEVGLAMLEYSSDHENKFPDSLNVLSQNGYIKGPLDTKSLLTGRPYVYVAGGQKRASRQIDNEETILLYDDAANGDSYQCVMGDGSGRGLRKGVMERLLKRGK